MERVLRGTRPTDRLHLGNYVGAPTEDRALKVKEAQRKQMVMPPQQGIPLSFKLFEEAA